MQYVCSISRIHSLVMQGSHSGEGPLLYHHIISSFFFTKPITWLTDRLICIRSNDCFDIIPVVLLPDRLFCCHSDDQAFLEEYDAFDHCCMLYERKLHCQPSEEFELTANTLWVHKITHGKLILKPLIYPTVNSQHELTLWPCCEPSVSLQLTQWALCYHCMVSSRNDLTNSS